jgi:glycosyltransferase involved in cell wall biosynthesis
LKRELLSNELTSWTKDYVQSKAFSRVFTKNYLTSIKKWEKVIVSNTDQQNELKKYDVDSIVIPGGIEERFITQENFTQNNPNQEKIILMTGRCDDPSKGMDTLLEAGKILLQKRNDFKILVTSFNLSLYNKWVIPLGWLPRKKLFDIYAQSDICVVPSEWAEPFGLIAIEAMAMGKAVIASRIGGLKEIIQDNENGILFEPKKFTRISIKN